MKARHAALLTSLTLAAVTGCTRPCKVGTVFLRLRYVNGLDADNIQVKIRQAGTSSESVRTFAPRGSEDSLEIDFPGRAYPRGAVLTIDVLAERFGVRAGGGLGQVTLEAGCTSFTVAVVPDPSRTISHVPETYVTNGTCDLIISASSLSDGFPPLDASILEGPMHTFDTGTEQLDGKSVPAGCISQLEAQQGGTEDAGSGASNTVAVLAVRNLTIEAGASLQVTGPYPLVIAAGDTIRVEGTIDASADHNRAGPGGLTTGPGVGGNGSATGATKDQDSGGAGGSFGSVGADGADAINNSGSVSGGARGIPYNDPSLSVVLEAGSVGGAGSGFASTCGLGGAGGGAIQLTAARTLQITDTGKIHVNGGGGLGGCYDTTNTQGRGGGGGGSGGALFLEAPSLDLGDGAVLTANGGGGGSGAEEGGGKARGRDGDNGSTTTSPAMGGPTVATSSSGTGGKGAAVADPATSGNSTTNTGGGGGGFGRIVIRARTRTTATATISPQAFNVPY